MKNRRYLDITRKSLALLGTFFLGINLAPVSAEQLVLTLDPSRSSVTLESDWSGVPLVEQGPGSLTTTYSGTVTVDVDNKLAPTTIEFIGSVAAAANNGSWLPQIGAGAGPGDPGTPDPANFGVKADLGLLGTAYAVLRDTVVGITNPAVPVTGNQFDSTQTLTALAGRFEYNVPVALGGDFGSDPYEGATPNTTFDRGTYSVSGSTITLTIPLEWIDSGDVTSIFRGTWVATASLSKPCDFNADSLCNLADIDLLVMNVASGGGDLQYDLTGDGFVNLADVDLWRSEAGGENLGAGRVYKVGDINLDSVVDGSDFGLWNSAKFTATGKWSHGDLNADGFSDGSDFGLWNANKFTAADGSLVPEPSAVMLLVMASGLAAAVRRNLE